MEYHYDYRNGENGSRPQPPAPNKPNGQQDNDFGAWVLIGVMFLVA